MSSIMFNVQRCLAMFNNVQQCSMMFNVNDVEDVAFDTQYECSNIPNTFDIALSVCHDVRAFNIR